MNIVVRALPELSSVLITWVSVGILFLILRKLLYNPVSKFLEDRKAKIQSDIDEAKTLKEEAQSMLKEYESKISQARKESQEIIENARKRGEELREDIIQEAKREAEGIISRARQEISREREAALESIRSEAGEIAVLIASKILEENLALDKQQNLIDKFIDEVGKSEWQN